MIATTAAVHAVVPCCGFSRNWSRTWSRNWSRNKYGIGFRRRNLDDFYDSFLSNNFFDNFSQFVFDGKSPKGADRIGSSYCFGRLHVNNSVKSALFIRRVKQKVNLMAFA